MRGLSAGSLVNFGDYGLKAMACGWITSNQIEAARRTIAHATKRNGRMWVRIFPDKPVTKKGTEVPMGGGKGAVDHYAFPIRPGRIIFEIDGIPVGEAKEALRIIKSTGSFRDIKIINDYNRIPRILFANRC